ncbi:MAG: excinuclease ABC subunit UvrB [Candidatus Eremiobacterota bacterium]
MSHFKLISDFAPSGDQGEAIEKLIEGINSGEREQTLLGVTGSGKTFTVANVIEKVGRPALVISHNKTLAAQLCSEFKDFFPENRVEYFVSYYDYYQPEAYIPQTDTYIEKDAKINDEIDRLRHAATQSIIENRDVIIVASISCIYGLGTPEDYKNTLVKIEKGQEIERDDFLEKLVTLYYERNDLELTRGRFRVKGEVIEIHPVDRDNLLYRIEFFGDEIDDISGVDPSNGKIIQKQKKLTLYPAKHFITQEEKLDEAISNIKRELRDRVDWFHSRGMDLESQRISERTGYDMECLQQLGYCHGIENYSRHLSGRRKGEPPYTLIDYFPPDFIVIIDESHVTLPQLKGMSAGDRSRKTSLIDHGFRLPSAYDNRPLTFEEFMAKINQVIYVSATPGIYELQKSSHVIEQIIRPTGLIDPLLTVKPLKNQVDDLINEIKIRIEKEERVLVTTLTKKMSEELAEYLKDLGIKVNYLHCDVDTLDRVEILTDLRLGEFDVLIGVNLLREGLDLPEVSLVAILDADKEGFLRSETSLIQTIGRAARNARGEVILYADNITGSIKKAMEETERRRKIQKEYNEKHGIVPQTVTKSVKNILGMVRIAEKKEVYKTPETKQFLTENEIKDLIKELEKAMNEASLKWDFERAAELRDEIKKLQKF